MIGTPVDNDTFAEDENTKYTVQKDLGDGKTGILTGATDDGTATADSVASIQKSLPNDGGTLIGTPVSTDGFVEDADTKYTLQKSLAGGYTGIATPVTSDGSRITGTNGTKYTKQIELTPTSPEGVSRVGIVNNLSPTFGNMVLMTYSSQETLRGGMVIIRNGLHSDFT